MESTRNVNKSFEVNTFPSNLKRSGVTPAYKAVDFTCRKTFRHISVCPPYGRSYQICSADIAKDTVHNMLS